jgi:hypothetical protein
LENIVFRLVVWSVGLLWIGGGFAMERRIAAIAPFRAGILLCACVRFVFK